MEKTLKDIIYCVQPFISITITEEVRRRPLAGVFPLHEAPLPKNRTTPLRWKRLNGQIVIQPRGKTLQLALMLCFSDGVSLAKASLLCHGFSGELVK